ncbi:Uncharacterized protein YP598_2268 [Yersinia pseudotuberculosis]|uniref:Uncharacterized protein n=1 Tax=Yersinia pseudotuberculosis serotype O:1b (strain IP 31758) TaxID=349747 RepID=A0A0U1R0G1_YERP3|nr:hypothetical protein [Yersinia pseudotuberculosis]ABS48604.1 hypothetical protein YpsIP31758_2211 [Yersinia pseudotuberculosis IP 31758]MCE4113785.1 hypothetical protein [Yersinia pseudotuberculosis]RYC28106.1 hypothetical protein EU971_01375 [Yersinia pseudotuberculosis]UFA61886.1 Uncharacterized protein YP598_2268 [Yersinia pseudotuberculosis]
MCGIWKNKNRQLPAGGYVENCINGENNAIWYFTHFTAEDQLTLVEPHTYTIDDVQLMHDVIDELIDVIERARSK